MRRPWSNAAIEPNGTEAAPRIGTALLRELAVQAHADPRTVRKVIAGSPVRGDVERRVRRVLIAEGIIGQGGRASLTDSHEDRG